MKKKYMIFLIIGVVILVVPTAVYLCFLIPKLTERYNTLMASAGVLGGFGYIGASQIPDKFKYSGLFKSAANSFTTMVIIMLIQEFIKEIVLLGFVIVTSVILFCVFKEIYKNGRRREENRELATEIARSISKDVE